MPVVGGELEFVRCMNTEPLEAVLPTDGDSPEITVELKRFYYAPITSGEVLGHVICTSGGREIGRLEIKAEHDVPIKPEGSMLERLIGYIKGLFGQ